MIIRFTSDAETELAEARQWYACQRKDLDIEFIECIDEALSRVARSPDLYPIVYRNLRRAVVRRFPFAVFYEVTGDKSGLVLGLTPQALCFRLLRRLSPLPNSSLHYQFPHFGVKIPNPIFK